MAEMPERVYFARSGTLLELSRDAGDQQFLVTILGSFQTARISIKQDNVDHNGPKDRYEMRTPRRSGWTASVDRYVPALDATPDDDESAAGADIGALYQYINADTNPVLFRAKLVDGTLFSGLCHFSQDEVATSDDPTTEGLEFESTGAWTIT